MVGFVCLDATTLLIRVQQLISDMCAMRKMLQEQVKVCENQQLTPVALEHWIDLIEQSRYTSWIQAGGGTVPQEVRRGGFGVPDGLTNHVEESAAAGDQPSVNGWSTVVKRGRAAKRVPWAMGDKEGAAIQAPIQCEQKKSIGIIGMSTACNIQVVTTTTM